MSPAPMLVFIRTEAVEGRFLYSRIEETTTDSVECPSIDRQRKAKRETDEEQLIQSGFTRGSERVGNLSSSEGKKEKQSGANKFPSHGKKVANQLILQACGLWHCILAKLHVFIPQGGLCEGGTAEEIHFGARCLKRNAVNWFGLQCGTNTRRSGRSEGLKRIYVHLGPREIPYLSFSWHLISHF